MIIDDRYEVKVEDIFEGPMDLLVYLIKKNEVDIYDIPIALITDQYLGYLEFMKALNIDLAGDFILMAATLAQIKSRMLLPAAGPEEDEEDPRMEIARPLMEYLQMKSVAEQLAERPLLGDAIFRREPGPDECRLPPSPDDVVRVDLTELIHAFRKVLENLPGDHTIDLSDEKVSVQDKMNELIALLEARGSVAFDELFSGNTAKTEIIVTFLAVLEMARLCLITVAQHAPTRIIRLFYL